MPGFVDGLAELALLSPTIPPPLDVALDGDEEFGRYERLHDLLNWWPHIRNMQANEMRAEGGNFTQGDPWAPDFVAAEPCSRLGGFSDCEINPDLQEDLQTSLPLAGADDQHVLLADLNPQQFTTADWFQGGRQLEIWIRQSDLSRCNFNDVWCFIRTDC